MITEIVVYTTDSGYKEFRQVPKDLHPNEYNRGILLGPPDLSPLKLKEKDTLALNNALVTVGLVNYKSLAGKRRVLLETIQTVLSVSIEEAIKLRLMIISLYQQDYYLIDEVINND